MSTFLELVQALHVDVGAAGVAPTSVTSQTGEAARLVNWIKRADQKIQSKWINWKFRRKQFSTAGSNTTTASVATLSKPADHHTWDVETFQITYPGETQANKLPWVEYEDVKDEVLDTTTGPPSRVIIMPNNDLRFEPVPDGVYTIEADYYKTITALAANSDTSDIPAEYHDTAILGRAMMFYANYENAPEIKKQGEELYGEALAELENHQLPNRNYSRLRTGGGFEVIAGQDVDD